MLGFLEMGKLYLYNLLTIFSLVAIFASNAKANFEFSPITMSLTTSGKGSHSIAQVVNREATAVPIVIRITERKLLENGDEERPDTNEIAVFPSQFLLEPKESKSIKITWQGEEKLPAEKAYRIIVEEVPVEFSAKTANAGAVKILINYVGSIYVNSDKTDGDLALEKIDSKEDPKAIVLSFNNKGTAHVILKSPKIELIAKGASGLPDKKMLLEKSTLGLAEGKNVLALSKLKIKIPKPSELQGYDNFDWKFTYEK